MTQKVFGNEKLLLKRDRLYTSRHLSRILKLAGIVPKKNPSMAIDLATILQELHYLLVQGLGEIFSGVRRVFYSLDAWVEKLPWLSRCTIRRRMLLLQEAGLIKFGKEKADKCWHVFWYELDYSKLKELDALRAGRSHREFDRDVSQDETSTFHQLNVDVSRDDIQIKDNSTEISNLTLSQREREQEAKKADLKGDNQKTSITSPKFPEPKLKNQDSLVTFPNPKGEKCSEPMLNRKSSKKGKSLSWLPDGPWRNRERNLDPNFRDWLASDWIARYGGTIHQRRADVLSHFKKDPANLVIRWEQYQGEYLHRYQNASLRMKHLMAIDPVEQEKLLAHSAALTHFSEFESESECDLDCLPMNEKRIPERAENPSAYSVYSVSSNSKEDLATPEQLKALFSRFSQKIVN